MDFKLETFLTPIGGEHPCGADLSFSMEFDQIQEARREDDPTVDYGEWQATLKQADWPRVIDICSDLLQKRSKDLRLGAWLSEALTKRGGLQGLHTGCEIMTGLVESFGHEVHPQSLNGDQEQRLGTFSWFVLRMAQLVMEIPITESTLGHFSLNDYYAASHLHAQLQRDPDASIGPDKITLEKFSEAVAKTDKARYRQWMADAERCSDQLRALSATADRIFDNDGPSFTSLIENVEAVRQRLQLIAKERGLLLEQMGAAEPQDSMVPTSTNQALAQGAIRTRAQALESLRQVAAFFRQTEPHSPVAYLADKAVRWGSMPLHSWLRTVVKDQGTLSQIEELLGLEMQGDGARQSD